MIYETVPRTARRIWGALRDDRGRPVGEMYWLCHDGKVSSELVGEGGRTSVANLVERKRLPEEKGFYPVLVKTLHPARELSVQVHPGKDGGVRKDETWFILKAEPGAWMMGGLNGGVGREDLKAAIEDGKAEKVLTRIPLHPGEMVHIPAGAVHCLGGGVEVLEVQSNTDVTYRLYDWNRLGADGRPRQLHLEEGLDAVDYRHRGAPQVLRGPEELDNIGAPYALRRASGSQRLSTGELLFLTSGRALLSGSRRVSARSCLLAADSGGTVQIDGEAVVAAPRPSPSEV